MLSAFLTGFILGLSLILAIGAQDLYLKNLTTENKE